MTGSAARVSDCDDDGEDLSHKLARLKAAKTLVDLEFKFRVYEGLMEFPLNTSHVYSCRLAVAADRIEEALVYMMRHLRQQKTMDPLEIDKEHFFKLVLESQVARERDPTQPLSKVEKPEQLRYSAIIFDLDQVDLFLQIGRKVVEHGRKAL
eukprot:CAMPEP_0170460066 /NCGR_PEP_ID=MMETSP0123-20130129/6553_1 /TAXON_ID=182087 /ORGANISM="Favella ehrenbergii, Strain Fehren 1" /LENGTH=151 /DNA_ID=CAMNT_0010724877 /DNA_START=50 /DNA_END=505 /DNA_ORIENTATION=-